MQQRIADLIEEISAMCDVVNTAYGKQLHRKEMVAMLLFKIGHNNIDLATLIEIASQSEKIFLKYPPVFIRENTAAILKKITTSGSTCSILSNTGFINGNTIRQFIKQASLDDFFSFQIYSDEIKASMPSSECFRELSSRLYNLFLKTDIPTYHISASDIIQIGCSERIHSHGAIQAGMNSFLINTTPYTINDIP